MRTYLENGRIFTFKILTDVTFASRLLNDGILVLYVLLMHLSISVNRIRWFGVVGSAIIEIAIAISAAIGMI